MPAAKTTPLTYQLKITLQGLRPPIWRRVLVAGDTTLARLHDIIQIVMGWTDSHMHAFEIQGAAYSLPEIAGELDFKDSRRVKLSQFITGEKFTFRYDYDFGDSWEHQILVEKILPPDPAQPLPVCLKGVRAGPPEDVGGVWGYVQFLEAISDPQHPEHADYVAWIDGDFDPAAFDLAAVNRRLRGRAG